MGTAAAHDQVRGALCCCPASTASAPGSPWCVGGDTFIGMQLAQELAGKRGFVFLSGSNKLPAEAGDVYGDESACWQWQ